MDVAAASPPSRRRATLMNMLGTGGNTAIAIIQAIVLVPVYLSALGPRLYGAWLGSGEVLGFLSLFDLGLTNVVIQRIGAAHAKGDDAHVGILFGSAALTMGVIGAILGGAVLAVSPWMGRLMHLEGSEAHTLTSCFRVGALTTFLYVGNFSVLGLCRATQDTALQSAGTIAGAIAGFVATVILLTAGAGLWAIALGSCIRALVVLGVSASYVVRRLRARRLVNVGISAETLRDFWRVSPATAMSGLGYLLSTRTESTLIATLMGPEYAPTLMLTRRAVDVAGTMLNVIAVSSYAGFAHLVASSDRGRSLVVYREVQAVWVSLALAAAAAYVAVNRSLVSVWVGPAHYGGLLLTVLVAAQVVVIGRAQVLHYMYRAAGAIVPGSLLQFAESVVRFGVTVALIKAVGLAGPALATVVVALPVSALVVRRTLDVIRPFAPSVETRVRIWSVVSRVALVMSAVAIGRVFFVPRWIVALPVGAAIGGIGIALQLATVPELATVRTMASRGAARLGVIVRPRAA